MSSASDNVFVTQMPPGLTEDQVTQIFSQYGTIISVRIVSKPDMKISSALVRFGSVAEASFVVESMNGNIPQGLSTPVETKFANPSRNGKGGGGGGMGGGMVAPPAFGGGLPAPTLAAPPPAAAGLAAGGSPQDNVFVTKMPPGLTEEQVTQIFAQYGSVTQTRIVSKPEMSFTSALVRFATVAEATFVVEGMNGNIPQGLDSPVETKFANPQRTAPGGGGGGKGMMGDDSARFSPYDGAGAAMVPYEGGKGKGKRDEVPMELIVRGLVESGGLPGGNGRDRNSVVEVYIHGLSSDCTDLHLYKVFSPFGQISPKGLKVMCDKDTGACIGYGFINFLSIDSAQLAIQTLNGAILPNMQKLRVELKGQGKNAKPETDAY